jgi:predicted dehydrogenase
MALFDVLGQVEPAPSVQYSTAIPDSLYADIEEQTETQKDNQDPLRDFDIASVSAQTYAKFGNRGLGENDWGRSEVDPKRPFDVEDFAVAFIRMKSGRTITLETAWAGFQNHETRDYGIDFFGTNAGLSLFPAKLYRNTLEGYETIQFAGTKVPHPEDRVHHFVNCVLDSKKLLVPPDESLKVQQVLDAIYASAASGKEVKLG